MTTMYVRDAAQRRAGQDRTLIGGDVIGDRKMAEAGYRWDVIARFPCNASGVRVGIRRTIRGAERYAVIFGKRNRVETSIRRRYDVLLDEAIAKKAGRP